MLVCPNGEPDVSAASRVARPMVFESGQLSGISGVWKVGGKLMVAAKLAMDTGTEIYRAPVPELCAPAQSMELYGGFFLDSLCHSIMGA